MVVWTQAQTTTWFTSDAQVGLSNEAYLKLQEEGITSVEDLTEFDDEGLKLIAKNARQGADPVILKATSVGRLIVFADLARYYDKVGRQPTPANMSWPAQGKSYKISKQALDEQKGEDAGEVPKLSAKTAPPLVWAETFKDYLSKCIGRQEAPLSYVIRPRAERPEGECPPAAAGRPHAAQYRSIKDELVERASHDDPLFVEDNETVFNHIEDASRGTKYATVLQPHRRTKDGRGAYMALINQYAGKAAWDAVIQESENVLHNSKWRGTGSFLLESHANRHRSANNKLIQVQEHKPEYQRPDTKSRWRHFVRTIETSDAALNAAIQQQNQLYEDDPNHDWELAVGALIAVDPVAKRVKGNKREHAQIGGVEGGEPAEGEANVSDVQLKSGKGKTGVDIRWLEDEEYNSLTKEQRTELYEAREAERKANGKSPSKKSKKTKSAGGGASVSSAKAVRKQVKKALNAEKEKQKKEEEKQEKLVTQVANAIANLVPSALKPGGKATAASSVAFQKPHATVPSEAQVGTTLKEKAKALIEIVAKAQNSSTKEE